MTCAQSVRRTQPVGVELIGSAHHAPATVVTNDDLAQIMDTSDEWIVQRTGIRERRRCDPAKGETPTWLATEALRKAIDDAGIEPAELSAVILATVTGEMTCPAISCKVAANVGATGAMAFDMLAACSGFVYGMQTAHDMILAGTCDTVAVIGSEVMSTTLDYSDRTKAVLFGDAAGAAILRRSDDPSKGILASEHHSDGTRWHDLYIPKALGDFPEGDDADESKIGFIQMNGREVYRFAVGTFTGLITNVLDRAGLESDSVDEFVCHQSNLRMLESARERVGIPESKMYFNIERYGNCSAASVPVALSELRAAGRCVSGQRVMMVAFGGGLTWGASIWQL